MKHFLCLFLLIGLSLLGKSQPFWFQRNGSLGNDEALDITHDNAGNHIVTGYFTQSATFGSTTLFTSSISDIFVAKYSPTGTLLWAVKAGGIGADRGYSVRTDMDGNIFITGYYNLSADFGTITLTANAGSQDIFVAKLDAGGNFIWARSMGSDLGDTGYGIAADNLGNVIVTGQFKGIADFGSGISFTGLDNPITGDPAYELFVAKLDSVGNTVWVQPGFSDFDDRGLDVDCDNAGNIYVVGQFSDTIQLDVLHNNPVQNAAFLLKLDAAGNEIDFRRMSAVQSLLYSIDIDISNNVHVCGEFQGNLAIQGTPVTYINATYTRNIFVARFDTTCNVVWTNHAGSESEVSAKSIISDGSGNVYIAGTYKCRFDEYADPYGEGMFYSSGYRDIFTAKYDNGGNFIWAKNAGGPNDDFCSGISLSPTSLPVIAGGMNQHFNFVDVPGIASDPLTYTHAHCPSIGQGDITYKKAKGERDVFVGSFIQDTTLFLDVFNHPGSSCLPDLLLPQLGNMGPDTTHKCGATTLTAKTQHIGPLGKIGAHFDYEWHDGTTSASHAASSTGWYSVNVKRADGCYENKDSIFVFIHGNPSVPLITDSYGNNIEAPPVTDSIYRCGTDTITLTASNVSLSGYHSWDEISTGSSFITLNDSIVKIYASGLYRYKHYNAYGCHSQNEIRVIMDTFALNDTLHPFLKFNPSADTIEICVGNSISISCNDTSYFNGHYMNHKQVKWNFHSLSSATFSTWDSHVRTYTPSVTGWFHVYAHLLNHCADSVDYYLHDSVYIIVNPKPTITHTLISDTYVCPADTVTHVFYSNASASFSSTCDYFSFADSLLYTVGGGHVNINLNLTDTITGCSNSKSVHFLINEYDKPAVSILPTDGIVCPGDSVLLSSEPGLTYSWVGPMGDSLANTQTMYVDVPGFYHCVVTDLTGCVLTSNTVEAKEYNTPYITAASNYICSNGTTTISANASSSALIHWEYPLSGTGSTVTVDTAGIYFCTISLCGISTYDSVTIIESNTPAYILAMDTILCPGDTIILTANSGMVDYVWTPGGSHDPFLLVTEAGAYHLQTTDFAGCYGNTDIIIYPAPQPSPPLINDTTICSGNSVLLTASASGNINWYINPTGGTPFTTGNSFVTAPLTNNTTYYLQTMDSICNSNLQPVTISIHSSSVTPVIYGDSTVCSIDSLLLYTHPETGVMYTWITPAGMVNDTLVSSFVGDTTISGAYALVAADAFCTSDTAFFTVHYINPGSLVIASEVTTVCPGDTVVLTASSGFDTYEWSNGDSGDSVIYVTDTTSIQVVASLNGCVEYSNVYTINWYPAALIPTSENQFFCVGDSVVFTATGDTLLNWYDTSGILLASGSTFTTPFLFDQTMYAIQSVSENGCQSAMQWVFAYPIINPAPNIGMSSPICEHSDLVLTTYGLDSSATVYWWTNDGFVDSTQTISLFNLTLADSGHYHVSYTANGCMSDTSVIYVLVNENPVVNAAGPYIACEGSQIDFDAISLDSTLDLTWVLSDMQVLEGASPTAQATSDINGWVVLTGVDSNGCTMLDSTMVIVNPLPVINFVLPSEICSGQTLFFNASIDSAASGYIHDDSLFFSYNLNDTITNIGLVNAGNYTVVAILNGCTDSLTQYVDVVETPQISLGSDTSICEDAEITWSIPTTYYCNWNDGSTYNELTASASGVYWVTATLGSCTATDTVELTMVECDPLFTTVFTPNGDGQGDQFGLISNGVKNTDLKIYDQLARIIYQTADEKGTWSGLSNDYAPASTGVYIWTATVENLKGERKSVSGTVHLIR